MVVAPGFGLGRTEHTTSMLISGRQAAGVLATLGLNLPQAQQVLRAGLAGEPLQTSNALLYEKDRVQALADRRGVRVDEVDAACPCGLVVVRLGRGQPMCVTSSWAERADLARGPWDLSVARRIRIRLAAERLGGFPLVATLGGFVVLGADITDIRGAGPQDGRSVLDLDPPGPWHATFDERRLPSGPGPACVVRGWPATGGPLPPGDGSRYWVTR